MNKFIDIKPCKSIHRRHWTANGASIKAVKKSLPFLESLRGEYAHRVKHVSIYTSQSGKSHFIVKVWCGASFCVGGDGKGQSILVADPTKHKPICATCEGRFIGSGQSGAREINGNKVMYRPYGYGA